MTGWPLVLDYDGQPIGFDDQKEVPSDRAVALEIWSGVGAEDEVICPPPIEKILNLARSVVALPTVRRCPRRWCPAHWSSVRRSRPSP